MTPWFAMMTDVVWPKCKSCERWLCPTGSRRRLEDERGCGQLCGSATSSALREMRIAQHFDKNTSCCPTKKKDRSRGRRKEEEKKTMRTPTS